MSDSISVIAVVRRTFDLYARQASLLLPAAVCLVGVVGMVVALSSNHARGLALLGLIVTVAALALFTGVVVQIVHFAGVPGRIGRVWRVDVLKNRGPGVLAGEPRASCGLPTDASVAQGAKSRP
jgi:hypothetical protein